MGSVSVGVISTSITIIITIIIIMITTIIMYIYVKFRSLRLQGFAEPRGCDHGALLYLLGKWQAGGVQQEEGLALRVRTGGGTGKTFVLVSVYYIILFYIMYVSYNNT